MQDAIERVTERFARIDRETASFAARTGLACPPGCGACCQLPEIETTVPEMLPLARELVREGRAEAVLAALERREQDEDSRCALYAPDPVLLDQGRCTAYAFRPMVCRLFGFAARLGREGEAELVECRTMRAHDPDGVAHAASDVRAGGEVPTFGDHAHGLAADVPEAGARRLPINAAMREAIARTLLAERLRLEAAL